MNHPNAGHLALYVIMIVSIALAMGMAAIDHPQAKLAAVTTLAITAITVICATLLSDD